MDWKAGDILYSYQGNYDADGNFVPGKEIKAKCTGIDAAGKPEIAVLTGAEFLESGTRMIRVGSFNTAARQKGMFFDTITASAPRLVIYNGFNNYNKFSEDYIVDPSLYITVAGALDSVYNENLGGYLTGQVGLYTKSLFADISGSSKLYIREDANNYIYFDEGNLSISATRFSLTSTNLGIFSGASAMILLGHATDYATAKIGLKNDGSGKLASGNISWDTSGNVTQTGTWTSTATITGAILKTALYGQRITINESGYANTIRFYDSDSSYAASIYGYGGNLLLTGFTELQGGFYVASTKVGKWGTALFGTYEARIYTDSGDTNAHIEIRKGHGAPTQGSYRIVYMDYDGLTIGDPSAGGALATINASGRITKVNNLAASSYTGYVLRSDGTSFTPQQLAFGSFSTTYYLASSSGGSPTIPVRILPYTVGSTTQYLLAVE